VAAFVWVIGSVVQLGRAAIVAAEAMQSAMRRVFMR
jgi:hypothetical protein